MEQADAQARQHRRLEAGPLLGGRGRLDPFGALDEGAHHIGSVTGCHLVTHARPGGILVGGGTGPLRADRRPSGGKLVELGHVEVAEEDHGGGTGDGSRRHHEQVGIGALPVRGVPTLGPKRVALLDTEPVLLVDHHDAQAGEAHLVGEQRVGADHEIDGARPQPLVELGALPGRGAVGEQRHRQGPRTVQALGVGDVEVGEERAHSEEVLLRQDLGGGHERPLVTALDRHQQRAQRHHRLARSHVALQESVHGQGLGQVDVDLGHGPPLRRGQGERQLADEDVDEIGSAAGGRHGVTDARASHARARVDA